MQPISFIRVLKFNPYHDKLGRFTTGPKGFDFVSPNKGNLNYEQAVSRTQSRQQKLLISFGKRINKVLGLDGDIESVVGAWSDGAENSTIGTYRNASYQTIRVAAALKGLLEKQKAVIAFRARKGGKSLMTRIDLKGDLASHHVALSEYGVEFHTLQKTANGVAVWVFQKEADTKLIAKLRQYAKITKGSTKTWRGDGDFIGSWTSRTEGAKAYRAEIEGYLKKHPTKRAAIEAILNDWRRRAGE